MYDALFELTNLSLFLKSRTSNVLSADSAIDRTIRIISALFPRKDKNGISKTFGTKMLEAKIAENDMKFKTMQLHYNSRYSRIDGEEFISKLTEHLTTRPSQ
jgi:hypothetical protein